MILTSGGCAFKREVYVARSASFKLLDIAG
jgi:hypothetical protein